MQVLEVTAAGVFLLGAVITVATVDGPSPMGNQAADETREEARNLLDVIASQDAPNNASANLLAHEIAHAYQGRKTLQEHVNRHFPHKDWVLTLGKEDGNDTEIARDGDPLGDVSTVSRLVVPQWTYSWHGARMETVSGEHPMSVASVPVHNSRSDRLPGEPVKVTVVGEEGGEDKRYHVYETVGRPGDGGKNATTYVLDRNEDPGVALSAEYVQRCVPDDLTDLEGVVATDLTGTEDPTNPADVSVQDEIPCGLTLEFDLPGDEELGAGSKLEVDIPRGWRYTGVSQTEWEISSPSQGTIGPITLQTELTDGNSISDGDELDLELNITTDPQAPFSTFEARLGHGDDGNGTLSRGEFVVPHPGAEAKGPRAVYTSLPYPGGADGTESWGIAFSNGLSALNVTQVRVESVEGTSLFSSGTTKTDKFERTCGTASTCGSLEIWGGGSVMAWNGSEEVVQGESRDMLLAVATTETTTDIAQIRERTYPTIHFDNNYTHELTRQVGAPGVYTDWVPPQSSNLVSDDLESDLLGRDDDGYEATDDAQDGGTTHYVDVEYQPRGELWKVESTFNYTVDASSAADEVALDTQGALAASRSDVSPSRTTTGSVVYGRVNASNILQEARSQLPDNDAVRDLRMKANLYSPPTLGKQPAASLETNLSAGVGEPITTSLAADITGDGVEEALVGAGDNTFHAYGVTAEGAHTSLWSQDLVRQPTSVAVGEADGSPRAFVGLEDGYIKALDSTGSDVWRYQVVDDEYLQSLHATDTDGDGTTDILWAVATAGAFHAEMSAEVGSGLDAPVSTLYKVDLDTSSLTALDSTEGIETERVLSSDGGPIEVADTDESAVSVSYFDRGGRNTPDGVRLGVVDADGSVSSFPIGAHGDNLKTSRSVADLVALDVGGDGDTDYAVLTHTPKTNGVNEYQIWFYDSIEDRRFLSVEGGIGDSDSNPESHWGALHPVDDDPDDPRTKLAYAVEGNEIGLLYFPLPDDYSSDDKYASEDPSGSNLPYLEWRESIVADVDPDDLPYALFGKGTQTALSTSEKASPCDDAVSGSEALRDGQHLVRTDRVNSVCVFDVGPGSKVQWQSWKLTESNSKVFRNGLSPTPVSLDLVETSDGKRLAATFRWDGGESVGSASGGVRFFDVENGRREATAEPAYKAPTQSGYHGAPVVGDGDGQTWVAVGTDRGYLVTVEGDGSDTRSQVSADRAEFKIPIPVGEDALFGAYIFEAKLSWSPTDLDAEQTVHMVSRFSVEKAENKRAAGGYVYETRMSVGTPDQR